MRCRIEINEKVEEFYKACSELSKCGDEYVAVDSVVDLVCQTITEQYIQDIMNDVTYSDILTSNSPIAGKVFSVPNPTCWDSFITLQFKVLDCNIRYTAPRTDSVLMVNLAFCNMTGEKCSV